MVRKGSTVRVRQRAWLGTALRRGFCVLGPDGASGDRCRGASGGARRPRSRPGPPPTHFLFGGSFVRIAADVPPLTRRRTFSRPQRRPRWLPYGVGYRRSVDLFVVDDSAQRKPTRSGMGALVAVGGVHIPSAQVRSLERGLDDLCAEAGFPKNEEFKWSPDKKLWMWG
jgi:hypothetical protein